MTEREKAIAEARRALGALYPEVHGNIARDVTARVEAAFAALALPQGEDARSLPDGTLVTCEHCPTPHPKGDDGRPCLFPRVAPTK